MRIFERALASEFKPREGEEPTGAFRRLYPEPPYGMHIVFGEEDTFEERYYTSVPLPEEEDREEWDRRLDALDLEPLKATAGRLLCTDLYPDFDPEKFTEFEEASQTDPNRVFLKEKSLLVEVSYALSDHRNSKRDMLTELRACELLKKSPHSNIVKYLGCRVQGNRVTGIYYERCIEIDDTDTPLKVEICIEGLRKGIEHIHSLGYCHNDIRPNNIMLKDDDTAVIVDFDACLPLGEKLGRRACKPFGRDSETSEEENDWFSVRLTERWMRERNEALY